MLSAQKLGGGKWKESAQCMHEHAHLGGLGACSLRKMFNFTTPEIA